MTMMATTTTTTTVISNRRRETLNGPHKAERDVEPLLKLTTCFGNCSPGDNSANAPSEKNSLGSRAPTTTNSNGRRDDNVDEDDDGYDKDHDDDDDDDDDGMCPRRCNKMSQECEPCIFTMLSACWVSTMCNLFLTRASRTRAIA
jgi:hypothetical protein